MTGFCYLVGGGLEPQFTGTHANAIDATCSWSMSDNAIMVGPWEPGKGWVRGSMVDAFWDQAGESADSKPRQEERAHL